MPPMERVPRTADEEAMLLRSRPPAWEYLLFAGVLRRQMQDVEPRWRDHEIGYVVPSGQSLSDAEAVEMLSAVFGRAGALTSNVARILAPQATEAAFGAPGQPGDPERIEHLTRRLVDVYAGLLDWAADLRGALVSDRYRRSFEIASHVVDMPLRQIRAFVEATVTEIDGIPAWRRKPDREPRQIELTLVLTVDEALISELNAEIARSRR